MQFRFTLHHGDESHIISEPDKWRDIKLVLERDKMFHSLVELFEVPLIFYRANDEHDGGMDFILNVIRQHGLNSKITLTIDISDEGRDFDMLYEGTLMLESYKVIDGRKLECPVVRDTSWAKFMNNIDTPVDIQSTESLSGESVQPAQPIIVNLTGQKLRQQYVAHLDKTASFPGLSGVEITGGLTYVQLDWNVETLSEIEEKFTLTIIDNPEFPANLFRLKYAGTCRVQATIDIEDSDFDTPFQDPYDYLDLYISFNGETPIPFSKTNLNSNAGFLYLVTRYEIDETFEFPEPGGTIHIYGVRTGNRTFYVMYQQYDAVNLIDVLNNITITHDTVFPDTQSESFLIHDLCDAIIRRIT